MKSSTYRNSEGNKRSKPFFSSSRHSGPDPFFLQTKLTIGQPGDKYEQEADAMADYVVNRQPQNHYPIQSKCSECEAEDKSVLPKLQKMDIAEDEEVQQKPMLQKMDMTEDEEIQQKPDLQAMSKRDYPEGFVDDEDQMYQSPIQMRTNGNPAEASSDLESHLSQSKGSGYRLPQDTQQQMESSFGADFSRVNIHTDSRAVQMNQELKAQAFTHGSDVYFNSGKYQPESTEGRKLIAHELTHVIQQRG